MKNACRLWITALISLPPLACGGERETPSAAALPQPLAATVEAAAIVTDLRAKFHYELRGSDDAAAKPVLPLADATGFRHDGERIIPELGQSDAPARVALPSRSDAAFEVSDQRSGASMRVRLIGARSAPAESARGYLVYRDALPGGAHLVHRATTSGTEDFLSFRAAPAESMVEYELELGSGIAGLRLISNTLELLDAGGAPRLRMGAPFVIDAKERRHDALVRVEGCAVDENPAAPWGRPVQPPGQQSCRVQVRWGESVVYPALLDPTWVITGGLAVARERNHAVARLNDGRVLVSGGGGDSLGTPPTCELYDPQTGTWSMTGSMGVGRIDHSATTLSDGRVLAVGGFNAQLAAMKTAELYNPTTGTWSATGSLIWSRKRHTETLLADGRVLVAGGNDAFNAMATSERYNPVSGTWSLVGQMAAAHDAARAVRLLDGSVLLMPESAILPPERYNALTGSWSVTGGFVVPRVSYAVSLLKDGRVLVAGGANPSNPVAPPFASAELYDPVQGTFSLTGSLATARFSHSASPLLDGRAVVAGGYVDFSGSGTLSSAELFDPTTGSWQSGGSMGFTRSDASATLLLDGRVLVNCGSTVGGAFTDTTAELFYPGGDPGAACKVDTECLSGFCVDGVCCDTACGGGAAGDCRSCLGALTGQSTDGICGRIVAAAAYVCRAGSGDSCNPAETCTGGSNACPADVVLNDGATCDDGTFCNGAETCTAGTCGGSAGDPCVANLGDADADCSESCNEVTNDCSAPDPVGSQCANGANAGACNATGACVFGNGTTCSAASECASGNCVDGVCCDGACAGSCEACNRPGSAGICGPAAQGTACRAAAGVCDAPEVCDGVASTCPTDTSLPDGTACNGAGICTSGACEGGMGSGGTGGGTGGASGSGGSAGTGGASGSGGSSAGTGGAVQAPGTDDDGGCGCHVMGRSPRTPAWWLAALALGFVAMRRPSARRDNRGRQWAASRRH